MIPIPKKLVRFAVTGAIGFILDFGCTFLLKEKLEVHPYMANSLGFTLAVVHNYFINKYWTFGERSRPDWIQFLSFVLISIIGLLLNTLLLVCLYDWFNFNFYIAKLMATVLVMLWNYIANSKITYRDTGRKKEAFVK